MIFYYKNALTNHFYNKDSRLELQNTPIASLQRDKTPPPHNKCPEMTLNYPA